MTIYLNVPYQEKDQAKRAGAWYDATEKKWYINENQDRSLFERWIEPERSEILHSHLCCVPGCDQPGSLAHTQDGSGPWKCSRHYFNRKEAGDDLTPAQRAENLREIAQLMRNFSSMPREDGRDWARKIIRRVETGDRTVSAHALHTAMQALS